MIKLYEHELSGNCYKAKLMLSLFGLKYVAVPIDLMRDKHKSSEFLKLNPLSQVPVLTDGDLVIRDSQAILVYLARRYGSEDWFPIDAESISKVVQWLSTAANEIQHGPATARLYYLVNLKTDLGLAQKRAHGILQVMDKHLQERKWLELDHPSIADVACYPYIGLAPEGGISLEAYPNIVAWIERIKKLPGYVSMPGL